MANNNITQLQLLRGTSGSNAAYVGLPGEITVDMESTVSSGAGVIRLHDGPAPEAGENEMSIIIITPPPTEPPPSQPPINPDPPPPPPPAEEK